MKKRKKLKQLHPKAREFKKYLKSHTNLSKLTIINYISQINLFLYQHNTFLLDNDEDKINSIRKFVFAGKRIYNRQYAIKHFLKLLKLPNLIKQMKEEEIKMDLKDRKYEDAFLTYPEIVNLVKELKHEQIRLILMIAYDTGLRIQPILKLTTAKIKYDSTDDLYYITVKEKGKKNITRYLTTETANHLNNYILKYEKIIKERKSKLFTLPYMTFWSKLKNMSRKIYSAYGISAHWIRRGRAQELYEQTKNLEIVREFLGHENIETTKRYLTTGNVNIIQIIKQEKRDW